jgi:hypothetical protein
MLIALGMCVASGWWRHSCAQCSFDRGSHSVVLELSLKDDPSRAARKDFTYWSAPAANSARLDALGFKIIVMFDQLTDQAGMLNTEDNCSLILEQEAVSMLSADSGRRRVCVGCRRLSHYFSWVWSNHSPSSEKLRRRHA